MNTRRAEPPIVALSVRVYQALLLAYPTAFQREYGPHMAQLFRDCCLRAFRRGGPSGMVRLWLFTLLDLVHSVLEQHQQIADFRLQIISGAYQCDRDRYESRKGRLELH